MSSSDNSNRPNSVVQAPHAFFEGAGLYWDDDEGQSIKFVSDGGGRDQQPKGGDKEEQGKQGEAEDEAEEERGPARAQEEISLQRWACSTCGNLHFCSLRDQRFHFKSDHHRLNVKRRLAGKEPMTEDQFEALVEGQQHDKDEISSISGSDEEDDSGGGITSQASLLSTRSSKLTNHTHIPLLLPRFNEIVYIWKCVLLGPNDKLLRGDGEPSSTNKRPVVFLTEYDILQRLKDLVTDEQDEGKETVWVVLLSRGGHFAGCVFDARKGSIIAHKTYHRYVVRAKAGGRQSAKDATGKAPKSAGASLRRHNEASLQREIKETLVSWKVYLLKASCIFLHAPSSNNHVFFGGEDPPLKRSDNRVRPVPITTRRPTFKEAKRIFTELTSLSYKSPVADEASFSTISEEKVLEGSCTTEGIQESNREISDFIQPSIESLSTGQSTTNDVAEKIGENASSTLHDAAKAGDTHLTMQLLEDGANPCVRDGRGRTPYSVAGDKETRNVFRRFMADHMELWDWHEANVPSALTDEMEAAQAAKQADKEAKRKAKAKEQKKLRKAKQKAQVEMEKSEQLADVASKLVCHGDKESEGNFAKMKQNLNSSAIKDAVKQAEMLEREKRAAAAERRMLAMKMRGSDPSSKSSAHSLDNGHGEHCSYCGLALAGIVPFYRFSYRYCSIACVDVHRQILDD